MRVYLTTRAPRQTGTGPAGKAVLDALRRIFKVDYPELAPPFFLSCA